MRRTSRRSLEEILDDQAAAIRKLDELAHELESGMARYGFEIAALWESTTVTDFELVYLLRWPDADTMERRWREFLADAEWIDIKRRMDEDIGEPVRKVTSRVLDALPYSPQPHAA